MKYYISLMLTICFMQFATAQQCKQNLHEGKKPCEGMQDNRHKGKHGRQGQKGMMAKLNLSANQKDKMMALRVEGKKKMDELNGNTSITVKEFNYRKTAIRKDMQQKRDAILTSEQKDQLAKSKKDEQNKREEKFNQKLEKQKIKLGLSDDQVQKMKANHEKSKAEVEKIKSDEKLNDQEKKIKIKSVMEKAKASRESILTKVQLKQIEDHKKQKKNKHKKHED